ncbi:MAG: cell envelope biogenesis protein TolA [Rhodobacteraceae bacterium]|nr:cell envelope biogenesis protein TolA [Paracoccaceae bacterium]
MRAGLATSLLGHSAILLWGAIALPGAELFVTPPVESLPVDLVSIEEFTQLRKGETSETEVREVAAVKPTETPIEDAPEPAEKPGEQAVEQASPPTPAPEPTPSPTPEPTPEPTPAAEPAPSLPAETAEPAPAEIAPAEQEPAPVEQPKPIVAKVTPRTKPTPPKPKKTQVAEKPDADNFNTNQIAALLNKVEPGGGSPAQTQDPASLGSRQGADNSPLSLSELDALRSQISACWSPPVGAVGADTLNVRVKFGLDQSGAVNGRPEVMNSSSNPAFSAAAGSAVRAVIRCAPYSLPIAKYESWREVIINFDPRELIGG